MVFDLTFFTECFVNNLRIDKYEVIWPQKKKIPPTLVITNPAVKLSTNTEFDH